MNMKSEQTRENEKSEEKNYHIIYKRKCPEISLQKRWTILENSELNHIYLDNT